MIGWPCAPVWRNRPRSSRPSPVRRHCRRFAAPPRGGARQQLLSHIREVDNCARGRCFATTTSPILRARSTRSATPRGRDRADARRPRKARAARVALVKRSAAATGRQRRAAGGCRGGDRRAGRRQAGPRCRSSGLSQQKNLRSLQLLSVKPVLYIANVEEASAAAGSVESGRVAEYARRPQRPARW